MTEATAPGKLLLVGEYAVLDGAPAIVAAFGVRARAKVVAISGKESIFFDAASGRAFYFAIDGQSGLEWRGEGPDSNGTILESVVASCTEHDKLFDDGPAFRVSIDTDEFFAPAGGHWIKLGLGSSSAALVALVGALVAELSLTVTADELLEICYAAHHRFQGGSGSGVDIASAVYGGVATVRPDPSLASPQVTASQWPDGLFALPAWTGHSASTPDMLRRYDRFRDEQPEAFARHRRRMKALAEQACVAWSEQSVSDILNALASYDDTLRVLDQEARIGINTEPHDRLRQLAENQGAVYKISGAGGGDFGLLLSDSRKVIERARESCREAGFDVLEKQFGAAGLTVE